MRSEHSVQWVKWVVSACGVGTVAYCLFILGFVVTCPDLGVRCLLVDTELSSGANEPVVGPQIQLITSSLDSLGNRPRVGDILLAIGRSRTSTFMHFTRDLVALRVPAVPPGGQLSRGDDPSKLGDLIPPLVEIEGDRWVEVEYFSRSAGQPRKCWLRIQSLPTSELVMSFVWFMLEFGLFVVGALAYWARPLDRAARLFFVMCLVTGGAFVGGYHWWVIAASFWLTAPFMFYAMLVPVVTLHFFLVYPQPKALLISHPRVALAGLYAIPLSAMAALIYQSAYSSWVYHLGSSAVDIVRVLRDLRELIYTDLAIAAVCFAATLVALGHSFFTTRNPLVLSQVRWILWAGILATFPVAYTLHMALYNQVGFALGNASVPMFAASLLFMLAYAVGIVRYKLMLVDEILSRGMLYYVVSFLATAGYSLIIASSSLFGMYQNMQVPHQGLAVMATITVAVLLAGWFRDQLQQLIDRRFFREKYQLDKALQRMNQAAGNLGDPDVLGERMLASCRDVLGVDEASLYLNDVRSGTLRLVAGRGPARTPLQFPANQEIVGILRQDATLLRQGTDGEEPRSPTQLMLRELGVELVHGLEVDGELAGVVLLGPRRDGAAFSAEDLTFLTALGQITSVALHSARVHQAASRMSVELQTKVEKIAEQQRLISLLQTEITGRQDSPAVQDAEPFRRDLIRGNSPAIAAVLETVRKVSCSQSSVLIRGESGTGKELLARTIHENSPRRAGPMVSVHCGALSAGLLESELFGHVKGAFTTAHRDRVGRFELAHGGTLFLDEIGDISLDVQIKLLRVLQERSFEPVGGSRTIEVDVRLITATHQNLEKLIAEGKFREDLFYRLNVISITLPPLRERRDDVIELALHFLSRAAQRLGKRITHLDDAAIVALQAYSWPGNVRELENALERAVVLAEGHGIALLDLPPPIVAAFRPPRGALETKPARLGDLPTAATVDAVLCPQTAEFTAADASEFERLRDALEHCGGNKAEAARLLGLPRSTYFSKLKKYRLS